MNKIDEIFCSNCGKKGCLSVEPVKEDEERPFLEAGKYDGDGYDAETEVDILSCECGNRMIQL